MLFKTTDLAGDVFPFPRSRKLLGRFPELKWHSIALADLPVKTQYCWLRFLWYLHRSNFHYRYFFLTCNVNCFRPDQCRRAGHHLQGATLCSHFCSPQVELRWLTWEDVGLPAAAQTVRSGWVCTCPMGCPGKNIFFYFFKAFGAFPMFFGVKNNVVTFVFFLTYVISWPKGFYEGMFSLFHFFQRWPVKKKTIWEFAKVFGSFPMFVCLFFF